MRKNLLIFVLGVISALEMVAETKYMQLSLKCESTTQAESTLLIELTDEPVISFSGDQLIIRTSISEITYPKSEVLRYNFVTHSSVEDIIDDNECISIKNLSNGLRVRGLREQSHISIYNINGLMIETMDSDNNSVDISFSNKPKGVYIVLINRFSYKYIWR